MITERSLGKDCPKSALDTRLRIFKFILKPYSLVPFIPLNCPKPSPHYTYYSLIHYIIYKCIMISVPNLIRCKVPRGKRSLFLLLWMYSTCIPMCPCCFCVFCIWVVSLYMVCAGIWVHSVWPCHFGWFAPELQVVSFTWCANTM